MAAPLVRITGIEDVQKFLDEAPRNIVRKGYRKALRAGIGVIAGAVQEAAPVRTSGAPTVAGRGESHPGDLKRSVVTRVDLDTQGRGGSAVQGFGDQDHVANWVEFGHRMVSHTPSRKVTGQVSPKPFIRAALASSGDAALEAFAQSMEGTMKEEYEGN